MASPGAMGRTIPSREATRAGQRVGRAVAKEDGDSVTQWLSHCPTEHHRGGTRGCVERSHPGSPLAPSAVSPRRGPLSLEDSHLSCASPHVPAVHHLPERTRLRAVAPPHPKGSDPGAQRPSGHLPAPCSHPKFHTVRFSPPQPISCLCNKSPAGGRHVSSHAPPLGPAPPCPGSVRCGHPVVPASGRPHPAACGGIPKNGAQRPSTASARLLFRFLPLSCVLQSRWLRAGRAGSPSLAGMSQELGVSQELGGRRSAEVPLLPGFAPSIPFPEPQPRHVPGPETLPEQGRGHGLGVTVSLQPLHKRCWRYPGREVLSSDPQPGGSLRGEPLAAPARPAPISPLHASSIQATKTPEEPQGGLRNRKDSPHTQAQGKDEHQPRGRAKARGRRPQAPHHSHPKPP